MSDRSVFNNTPTTPTTTPAPLVPLWERLTLRQVAIGTVLVVITLLAVALIVMLREVFVLLFLGIVVATAVGPLVDQLRKLGLGRNPATVLAFALFLLVIVGIVAALVPFFVAQIGAVLGDLPARYVTLRTSLAASPTSLLRMAAAQLPDDPFSSVVGSGSSDVGTLLAAQLPSLGQGLLSGVLVLLLSYYWLYYRALAVQSIALLIPIDKRAETLDLWNQIETKIGAFVRGLFILSVIIGVMSGIGYGLIGLPYALTIAIIAGILEAVPYVGPFITMAIAGVVALTVSPQLALLSLGIALVIQFFEGYIIVPRVMDKAVGVNAVVTLLALSLFAELFGLLGALLAVPLAAAFQVLLDRFVLRAATVDDTNIGGRDQLALLRYRTRDLATDLQQRVRGKIEEITDEEDALEDELESLLLDLDGMLTAAQEQRT